MSYRHAVPLFLLLLSSWTPGHAAYYGPPLPEGPKEDSGVFIVDGSAVHNVGEVHLNITNWGLIGSMPGVVSSYEASPSAMWPAGSGVDYLFAAGLWVGALKNGVPLVSTGIFERELLPTSDPLDTIYRTGTNQPGGARYPYPNEDDDFDGRANEEILDGRDNDRDGAIDEDFAAIGEQEFRLTMRDDSPVAIAQWPDHQPLGLEIVQESYQWSKPELADAVAFEYTVRNVGDDVLEGVVLGFYVDGDIGSRTRGSVAIDDMVGMTQTTVIASDGLPVSVSIAYMYDCDGDDGEAPGYIGFMFVNSNSVPRPQSIGSFAFFSGTEPYEDGGDPTNDAERYEVMTGGRDLTYPVECGRANDYRMLLAFRPGAGGFFPPGARLRFQTAIVMGEDLEDLVRNASEMAVNFYGQWFDRDQNPETGVKGRETRVCRSQFGDALFSLFVDCGFPKEGDCDKMPPRPSYVTAQMLDDDACVWIDGDCAYESSRGAYCGLCRGDFEVGDGPRPDGLPCTGISGKEFHVPWLSDPPPPSPNMRLWATNNRVHLFWDSEPEEATDVRSGLPIFESYRIWRSDGWTRPLGSSVETGPASASWTLIAEFDKVDSYLNQVGHVIEEVPLGRNTGLDVVRYVPAILQSGSSTAMELAPLVDLVDRILAENPNLDVDTRLRYRQPDGTLTAIGRDYPELDDWRCCLAQADTLLWARKGRSFYEYIDDEVLNGFLYFHALTIATVDWGGGTNPSLPVGYGTPGSPRVNFELTVPQSVAQTAEDFARHGVATYVVPNPATRQAMNDFSPLDPNQDDPTGLRIEFRNLPRARNVIQIFTLSGDLVATLEHDGRDGAGSMVWNLVTRNGQQIVSGIYLFTVESDDSAFDRQVGRFVVIW